MSKPIVPPKVTTSPQASTMLKVTVTGKERQPPVKSGGIMIVPIESWYLQMQLLYWQSRRVALPGLDPKISQLSPAIAESYFRATRAIFFGNLMVSTPAWKLLALEALNRHVRAWSVRIKKTLKVAEPPADLSAFDALEGALLSELLGVGAAKMDQSKKLAEALLKNYGAAHPGMPSGASPVFDTASGAYGFIANSEIDRLLNSGDGLLGMSGGGIDLSSGFGYDYSNENDKALDGHKDVAEAQGMFGGATIAMAGVAGTFFPPLGLGMAIIGYVSVTNAAFSWEAVGKAKIYQGHKEMAEKGGGKLPGTNDIDQKKGIVVAQVAKKSTAQVLKEIEEAKSGYNSEGDLTKSQKAFLLMKWGVTHPSNGAKLSVIVNKSVIPPDKSVDDTGLAYFSWLYKLIPTVPGPKSDNPDPGGTEYDTVGKEPGFPPKAIGFATDYIDTSDFVQDLTIEYEVSTQL